MDDFEAKYQAARRKQEELAELEYVQRTEGLQAHEALQKAFQVRVAGGHYASWGRRVVPRVVDTLLVIALVIAGVLAAARAEVLLLDLLAVVWLFVPLFYFPLFHAYASGQTPGKGLLGIAVHRTEGSLGFGRAVWRTLVEAVMGIIVPLGVADALWPLWDGRNQSLHDKAADTVVIRTAGGNLPR